MALARPRLRAGARRSRLLVNAPFPFGDKATAAEYKAGLDYAIVRGWRELHESGTYMLMLQAGSDLFA